MKDKMFIRNFRVGKNKQWLLYELSVLNTNTMKPPYLLIQTCEEQNIGHKGLKFFIINPIVTKFQEMYKIYSDKAGI